VSECKHLDQMVEAEPQTPTGCTACLAIGGTWVHLRLCLGCGFVGCCDNSPNQHATHHFEETSHPLIQSFERGEDWVWCYVDEVMIDPPSPRASR
jgi:uncharacterized UBP type Zn finger protein